MTRKMVLGAITLLVDDYDKALSFYIDTLGFTLIEDTAISDKRWVVIAADLTAQTHIILAKASTPAQKANIGSQAGERVWLFLHVEDFDSEFARLSEGGVNFIEAPRNETYGKVAVFADCYGNKWDLIQRF